MFANVRLIYQQRAARLVLAWTDDDKPALDAVIAEIVADPAGGLGVLLAQTSMTADLAVTLAGDRAQEVIRAALLRIAADQAQADERSNDDE